MNKKTFRLFVILFSYGFLFTQNIIAMGANDGYSGSRVSLQEFTRRFNEIKNNNDLTLGTFDVRIFYGSYAGSQHSLQEFTRRFNEIKNNNDLTLGTFDVRIFY